VSSGHIPRHLQLIHFARARTNITILAITWQPPCDKDITWQSLYSEDKIDYLRDSVVTLPRRATPETSYNYISLAYPSNDLSRIGVDRTSFTLKVFPREEYEETEEEPWFSWGGCDDDLACKELPYSVASFRLEKTVEEAPDECLMAAEHSAGMRGNEASVAAALLAVAGLVMFW
jgi:hypothetical protein